MPQMLCTNVRLCLQVGLCQRFKSLACANANLFCDSRYHYKRLKMTEYYNIVPWFNSNEWHGVYNLVYSPAASAITQEEALKVLLMWKARCPSLPSGVESTLTLLEVYIQDQKNSNDSINYQLIRLAYSSAIMRFVNHMLDTETAKGTSLYQAAKLLEVPDWIIDLRHDTAHSSNLPSIELLREACTISLDWLKTNYWDKHKLVIKDYISGQKETEGSKDGSKIEALMSFCVSLSICASSRNRIKNLSEIPDVDMRDSIVSDARDLFGDQIDLSNLKTVSVMGLINLLNTHSKKLLKSKDSSVCVNRSLLGDDSLFLSLELLNYVNDSEFYNKNKLCKNYLQCFEILLTFLHSHNLILDFILALIRISECTDNNVYRSRLAALWVSEILKALKRSKQFKEKTIKMSADNISVTKRKELKLMFWHWFPSEKSANLLLDLQKAVPQELTDINFIQPIISTYNPNLTFFIKDMLNLIEPNLPKATTQNICFLAKVIADSNNNSSVPSKIYTVDDLKMEQENGNYDDEAYDSDVCIVNEPTGVTDHEMPTNCIWKLASTKYDWSKCPIGILPWQQSTATPIEMEM